MRFVEVKVVAEAETAIARADERVMEGEGGFLNGREYERMCVCYLFLGNKRGAVIESSIHCCFSDCRQTVTRIAWKVYETITQIVTRG